MGVIAVDIGTEQADAATPAKNDLKEIRSKQDRSRAHIQLSGATYDDAVVHLFVMALNGTALFESAKLHSMAAISGDEQGRSEFLIRLTVRPGYGQQGGPLTPATLAADTERTTATPPSSDNRS